MDTSSTVAFTGFRHLSGRETQLIILAGQGLTDKEIAKELNISPGTVITLWSKTRAKLGISSRIYAVAVMVSAITRLSGRIASLDEFCPTQGVFSSLEGIQILVNSRQVILATSPGASLALGVLPGRSLADLPEVGAVMRDQHGRPLQQSDFPWVRALRDGMDVSEVSINVKDGDTTLSYILSCKVIEDPVLNRITVLDFRPGVKLAQSTRPLSWILPPLRHHAYYHGGGSRSNLVEPSIRRNERYGVLERL